VKRAKIKGRFVALPHSVLESDQFVGLNHASVRLLLLIAKQYRGDNNGRLVACPSYFEPLGWRSRASATRCLDELIKSRLICRVRIGTRQVPAWYALAWWPCDWAPATNGHLAGDYAPFRGSFSSPLVGERKPIRSPLSGQQNPARSPLNGEPRADFDDSRSPLSGHFIEVAISERSLEGSPEISGHRPKIEEKAGGSISKPSLKPKRQSARARPKKSARRRPERQSR
jgi:hypothetical protein